MNLAGGNRKLKDWIPYLGLFCFIFWLTSSLVYITDDWHFQFVFKGFMPGENERRINNLQDVWTSVLGYYGLSGGRVFSHGLLFLVLRLPKVLYNLINSFMFTLMAFFTNYLSVKGNEKKLIKTLLLFFLLIIFLPSFGDTCLWTSGAVNYLWMSLFPLAFLVCYEKGWWKLSLLFALLSGFTNETTSGVLAVYLFTRWITRKEGKKNLIRIFLQVACMLPGMVCILSAPGNYNRAQIVNQTEVFSLTVSLKMLGKTFLWLFQRGYFVLMIGIVVIPFAFRKDIIRFLHAVPFFVASIAGMTALTLSGTFLRRAQFLNVILLIISFFIVLETACDCIKVRQERITEIINKLIPMEKALFYKKITCRIGGLFLIAYVIFQVACFQEAARDDRNRMNIIETSVQNGEDVVYVNKSPRYTAGIFYPEEGSISREYEALWMGLYYGIKIQTLL